MTWDAILALLLTVAIPSLLSLAGGILAIRSLGPEKYREKVFWSSFFVFIFLVAVVLAFWQQVRLTVYQTDADKQNAEIREKASGDTKYMQGELDAIGKVLQTLAQNSDPKNSVPLMKALIESRPQAPPVIFPAEPSGPTNAQFADGAKDLARRFRQLQQKLNGDFDNERAVHKNMNFPPGFYNFELSQLQPLRTEALALRRQILNRLPPQPENDIVRMVLDENSIAGANPLYDVADYFEQLAAQLQTK